MFFPHWFWTILSVLKCILNVVVIDFSTNFYLVFVSSGCLVIQFRSFDQDIEGEGEPISSYIYQFLSNSSILGLVLKL